MSSPALHTLDQLLSTGQPDGIQLEQHNGIGWDAGYRDLSAGDSDMGQKVTVRLAIDRYGGVLTMSLRAQHSNSLSCDQAKSLHTLLGYANQVADSFNERMREEQAQREEERRKRDEEARREREKRMEERRKERERLEAALAERKETLLNELVEEQGRIRLYGMKRWRPVTVQVQEYGDGSYVPMFRYRYEKHGYSESLHQRVMAFHVKLHGKFYAVWDEGTDDLPEWERDGVAKEAKPYAEADQAGEEVW